jgi:16S rRNA (uracil1498-N3)-methyltransferase
VSELVPLLARHSVPRWSPAQAAARAERWQRIADAAAEQCERSIPMHVLPPRPCDELVSLPSTTLLLHERKGESLRALATHDPAAREIGLLLGPEGGWDDDEVAVLRTAGALPIHLGPRILRAETASIAAITLVQYLWGDLG